MATQIVAVVCNNNDDGSYTVVLERDGVRVKAAHWSYVYAVAGTRRLDAMFEQTLADTGAMSDGEWQDMLDEAEDLYDE